MMGIGRRGNPTVWAGILIWLALALLGAACSQQPAVSPASRAAKSSSTTQAQYESAAKRALGAESQLMLSGDLAHNGHIELLVVNRLPQAAGHASAGVAISRVAILERNAENWREVFLADDHLKNEKGFLQGTPQEAVSAWRLRYEQGKGGLEMFFTPLQQPAGYDSATIDVRWNPGKRRYQSFDRKRGYFLAEAPSLGKIPSFVMKR